MKFSRLQEHWYSLVLAAVRKHTRQLALTSSEIKKWHHQLKKHPTFKWVTLLIWFSVFSTEWFPCLEMQIVLFDLPWHHSWLWLFRCDITAALFDPLSHHSWSWCKQQERSLVLVMNSRSVYSHSQHCNSWSICQQSLTHMEAFVIGSPESFCVAALW